MKRQEFDPIRFVLLTLFTICFVKGAYDIGSLAYNFLLGHWDAASREVRIWASIGLLVLLGAMVYRSGKKK